MDELLGRLLAVINKQLGKGESNLPWILWPWYLFSVRFRHCKVGVLLFLLDRLDAELNAHRSQKESKKELRIHTHMNDLGVTYIRADNTTPFYTCCCRMNIVYNKSKMTLYIQKINRNSTSI